MTKVNGSFRSECMVSPRDAMEVFKGRNGDIQDRIACVTLFESLFACYYVAPFEILKIIKRMYAWQIFCESSL